MSCAPLHVFPSAVCYGIANLFNSPWQAMFFGTHCARRVLTEWPASSWRLHCKLGERQVAGFSSLVRSGARGVHSLCIASARPQVL